MSEEQVPIAPETLAWALQAARGHDLRARTKLVLLYQAAYGPIGIRVLSDLTELSRNEVRIALRELADLGWLDSAENLKLPPRFANEPHPPEKLSP